MAVKRAHTDKEPVATPPTKKAKKTHFDRDGNPRDGASKDDPPIKHHSSKKKGKKDTISVEPAALPNTARVLQGDDIDFPRGGGSTLNTTSQYEADGDEPMEDHHDELFKDASQPKPYVPRAVKERRADRETANGLPRTGTHEERSAPIYNLTYKTVSPETKVLCCIISVKPLALIVSLPGQLVGHVPVTQISSSYTRRLDTTDSLPDVDMNQDEDSGLPELSDMFSEGMWLRAVVTKAQPLGVKTMVDLGAVPLTDDERSCGRVELSIAPENVNVGVTKDDLTTGFTLPAAVRSVEDHGYILDFGIAGITGFLSFDEAHKGARGASKLPVGMVIQCSVTSLSANGRTCSVSVDPTVLRKASASEASSISSLLPGTLVSALITDVSDAGINLQVLGLFQGTINFFHLPRGEKKALSEDSLGRRIKARVLHDVRTTTPASFALSLLPHVLRLESKSMEDDESKESKDPDQPSRQPRDSRPIAEAFPRGTRMDAVKVVRVHSGWGLTCGVVKDVLGFVSISDVSKEEKAKPRSWAIGTVHAARVLGYAAIEGVLKLTVQSAILEEPHLIAADLTVGQILKVTVKRLTPSHMLMSISETLSAIVFPSHYSDVALKHPEKKFVVGTSHKARVHYVDPQTNKVRLTLKKSLIQSQLPAIYRLDDTQTGVVVHGSIYKFLPTGVLVEYFGDLKAFVGVKELSDEPVYSIPATFTLGQVVKTRITSINRADQKIWASIRQALPSYEPDADLDAVNVGDAVKGTISAVHKNNVRVTLDPSKVTALVSLFHLARQRNQDAVQARLALTIGEVVEGLVVTRKNEEDRIVVCAYPAKHGKAAKGKETKGSAMKNGKGAESDADVFRGVDHSDDDDDVDADVIIDVPNGASPKKTSFKIGDIVEARVSKKTHKRTELRVGRKKAYLAPTDIADDYASLPTLSVGQFVKATVIAVMKTYLQLSMRTSLLEPSRGVLVADREINGVDDLKAEEKIRGFVSAKSGDHYSIILGRKVTATLPVGEGMSTLQVGQVATVHVLRITYDFVVVYLEGFPPGQSSGKDKRERETYYVGDQVDARVQRKSSKGLLLRIVNSQIRGLCPREEITGNPDVDVDVAIEAFQVEDLVRTVVLRNDAEKGRMFFSLKRSRFGAGGPSKPVAAEHDSEANDSQDEPNALADEVEEENDSEPSDHGNGADDDDETLNPTLASMLITQSVAGPSSTGGTTMKLQGFQWSSQVNQEAADPQESDAPDSDAESSSPAKRSKSKPVIQQDLTVQMHTKTPESSAEFERLLRATPDSSLVWIQFMAFQLQLSEVGKAREIGRRALQVINFREEQEKLNVWMALLNLEVAYGTEETLQSVFNDAIRANDAKTVYLRVAALLEEAGKHEQSEAMYERATTKFATSSKVWTLYCEHCLRQGKLDDGRQLLPRSLKSLEKRKHLKTITKFALLEYQLGDPERGKTIFEGIIDSHPKRYDLWVVYMDQEVKLRNIDALRNIYGRLFRQKLSAKKAKFFFKKWLETERSIGDDRGAENVKAQAIDWMEHHGSANDT